MSAMAAPTWAPDCMDADEFASWQQANRSSGKGRAERPCDDCPASYAAEMRAENRCNGVPLGDVKHDDDDRPRSSPPVRIVPGRKPAPVVAVPQVSPSLKRPEQPANRRLRLLAPCEDCLHDDLCAIKANLGYAKVEITAESIPPEVTLLDRFDTLRVDCARYVDRDEYQRFIARREAARERGRAMQRKRRGDA